MIQWLKPVVRGSMSFTKSGAQTTAGDTFSGSTAAHGTTNVTGITTSSSFFSSSSWTFVTGGGTNTGTSGSSSSASNSESSSYYKTTLPSYTSATTTIETIWTSTTETTRTTTGWTTDTLSTNDTNSATFTFATTEKTVSATSISFVNTSTSALAVTEDGTAVANVYDTIYMAERDQYAVAVTSTPPYVDGWNGVGMIASGTISGTRITRSAVVNDSSVMVLPASGGSQSIGAQTESSAFSYSSFATGQTTSTTSIYNYSQLPNATTTYEYMRQPLTQKQFSEAITFEYGFVHQGNTVTKAVARHWNETEFGIVENGSTYRAFSSGAGGKKITIKTVTELCDAVFVETYEQAGGNTTYVETKETLGLHHFGAGVNVALMPYNETPPQVCYIVKPYGVINSNNKGGFVTITGTTFQSVEPFALASRDVPLSWNYDNERALRTLTTTSNDSFTLSGNSITYTVTGSVGTSSQQVSVSGSHATGIVATKPVLGGSPEESATFYQFCPRGLYYKQQGTATSTTIMDGSYTKLEHGDSADTMMLHNAMFFSYSGSPVLFFTSPWTPNISQMPYE